MTHTLYMATQPCLGCHAAAAGLNAILPPLVKLLGTGNRGQGAAARYCACAAARSNTSIENCRNPRQVSIFTSFVSNKCATNGFVAWALSKYVSGQQQLGVNESTPFPCGAVNWIR